MPILREEGAEVTIDWNLVAFVAALCAIVGSVCFIAGYSSGEYNGWCEGRRELNCYSDRGVSIWRRDRLRGIRK